MATPQGNGARPSRLAAVTLPEEGEAATGEDPSPSADPAAATDPAAPSAANDHKIAAMGTSDYVIRDSFSDSDDEEGDTVTLHDAAPAGAPPAAAGPLLSLQQAAQAEKNRLLRQALMQDSFSDPQASPPPANANDGSTTARQRKQFSGDETNSFLFADGPDRREFLKTLQGANARQ